MRLLVLLLVVLVVLLCSSLNVPTNNPTTLDSEVLEKTEQIAEQLRQEPWDKFSNNCFHKSLRFRKQCLDSGIEARAVFCFGIVREKWFGHQGLYPKIHAWGDIGGRRIEVARPIGALGLYGSDARDIKPVIAIWY